MRALILVTCLLPAIALSAPREARQFGWLRDIFIGSKETAPVSQRRTQIEEQQNLGRRFGPIHAPPRPASQRLAGPRGPTNYAAPTQRKLASDQLQKRLLMPVIISSYASTNIQGQKQDEEELLGNEPLQLDTSLDSVEPTVQRQDLPTTTTTTTTTESTSKSETLVLGGGDVEQSPYFPSIPPTIEDQVKPVERYQLVVKDTSSSSTQNQDNTQDCIKNKCKNKEDSRLKFTPSLKKPEIKQNTQLPPPSQKPVQLPPRKQPSPGRRVQPQQGNRLPPPRGQVAGDRQQFSQNKPKDDSSFFDFFWRQPTKPNPSQTKPKSQVGQAPYNRQPLPPPTPGKNTGASQNKYSPKPVQNLPIRPVTEQTTNKISTELSTDKIENKVDTENLQLENEIEENLIDIKTSTEPEPFIVTGDIVKPPPKNIQKPLRRGPPAPPKGYRFPPKGKPLPKKPLHPPNRKQAPFVNKPNHIRPHQHKQHHFNNKLPISKGQIPPQSESSISKTKPFPPRLNPTSFRRQDIGPIVLKDKPDSSEEVFSLSSFLTSFFSTTTTPPPKLSLPTLVEDTEFSEIKREPIRTTTASTTQSTTTNEVNTEEKEAQETTTATVENTITEDEELDSLSAPKPLPIRKRPIIKPTQFRPGFFPKSENRQNLKPNQLTKNPLAPRPPPQQAQKPFQLLQKPIIAQKPSFRKPVLLQQPINVKAPLQNQVLIGGPKAPSQVQREALPVGSVPRPANLKPFQPAPRPGAPPSRPFALPSPPPPPQAAEQSSTTQAPRIQPASPSTTILTDITTTTQTTLSPIQEAVREITGDSSSVTAVVDDIKLKTLQKNFEQKKNIFEKFVAIDAHDTVFLPNAEVHNSDWRIEAPKGLRTIPSPDLALARTASLRPTTTLDPTTERSSLPLADLVSRSVTESVYPNERNAEGGFKPMIKPLHSPLLS